ncbi:hypothetical protein JCM10449v2_000438 [Rhodotorula kratochvilovae]
MGRRAEPKLTLESVARNTKVVQGVVVSPAALVWAAYAQLHITKQLDALAIIKLRCRRGQTSATGAAGRFSQEIWRRLALHLRWAAYSAISAASTASILACDSCGDYADPDEYHEDFDTPETLEDWVVLAVRRDSENWTPGYACGRCGQHIQQLFAEAKRQTFGSLLQPFGLHLLRSSRVHKLHNTHYVLSHKASFPYFSTVRDEPEGCGPFPNPTVQLSSAELSGFALPTTRELGGYTAFFEAWPLNVMDGSDSRREGERWHPRMLLWQEAVPEEAW